MPFMKNAANQKVTVYAWDIVNDAPKTGDAANITAQISKDGAASAATNDTNPTELDSTNHPGVYVFDMTQAESNANMLNITPKSSTTGVIIEPVTIYTEASVTQTGDAYAAVGALNDVSSAEVNAACDTALSDYDAPTKAEMDSAFAALNDISVSDIFNYITENGKKFIEQFRLIYAGIMGLISGAGTTTIHIRDDANTKDRVVATVDVDGNRTAFTTKDGS